MDARNDFTPEAAGFEHVRLVDARHLAACGVESDAGYPLHLLNAVLAEVACDQLGALLLAEVDAAGQFTDDQQIGARDSFLAQRTGVNEGLNRFYRA